MPSVSDRVSRGAELLDREQPGWAGRISLADLCMNEHEECVLGQIFGDFADGVDALGISGSVSHFGFNLGDNDMSKWQEYSLLALAWIAEIERRRGLARS